MHQLYHSPSTAAMVVHWLLIELKVEHQLMPLNFAKNEQKSVEYLKINPAGVVPALVTNGKAITESAAISIYLADTYSYGSLAPKLDAPERGEYLQWMFFFANSMQPAFRYWYYPQEFGGETIAKPNASRTIENCFDRINQHLSDGRDYFLGDKISTVDFFATMLMRWSRNLPKPATEWQHINQFVARMKSMASFKEVYKREGITDWV